MGPENVKTGKNNKADLCHGGDLLLDTGRGTPAGSEKSLTLIFVLDTLVTRLFIRLCSAWLLQRTCA